ncbi:glycosyltransferase [Naumannella sp. ID2617S]|uniref:Glycosyl transferase family 1 n=1 Tax=Enemella dayhoffiae TaxID=2016507 RepID=A0A255GST5_9ACTN|nr:glycosyltransferase [Enemella dayhoffiae]NNG20718.1 glycosyltransferase [Naumannella sp. ID2617S]OYO18680.1 glycosyl transferase family 1 [Enemella dayhoffiae]
MRVLINAGPWLPVPPEGYGGIENVIATLVPPLRELGCHVTLAGVGTCTLEVDEFVATLPEPMLANVARPYNQVSGIAHAHMHRVVDVVREGDFDVVHDHLEVAGAATMAAMGDAAPPTLQTLHWDMRKHPEFYSTFDGRGRVAFAAVSQSQLDRAPENLQRQAIGVVPLSTPVPEPMQVEPGEHALVLARITRDKGQDIAIRACARAGVPLVLAGPVAGVGDPEVLARRMADPRDPVHDHPDTGYFAQEVAPLLDGERARWIGGVSGLPKEELLRSARCLLTPNRWAEPGATGVVEALMRGIPVVGTPLGVLPSLVEDGVTGFLVEDEEGIARAIGRLDEIDPAACRHAARDWTPAVMAQSYLELYQRLGDR